MKTDFTKRELKVLLWVIRNGYGFNKEQSACDLDAKSIAEDTGLDRSHVWKTLHMLESKNVLMLVNDEIRFNRHSDQWSMAKTATKKPKPKQPSAVAETAIDHGQNSHVENDKQLSVSDIGDPKNNKKIKDSPKPQFENREEGSTKSIQTFNEIVAYLNETTGSRFKSSSKKTQRLIRARLSEGFTVDDFKNVIEVKSKQWLGDNKMEEYLRPDTLFSNKFEGYLQQANRASSKQKAFGFADTDLGVRGYGL